MTHKCGASAQTTAPPPNPGKQVSVCVGQLSVNICPVDVFIEVVHVTVIYVSSQIKYFFVGMKM